MTRPAKNLDILRTVVPDTAVFVVPKEPTLKPTPVTFDQMREQNPRPLTTVTETTGFCCTLPAIRPINPIAGVATPRDKPATRFTNILPNQNSPTTYSTSNPHDSSPDTSAVPPAVTKPSGTPFYRTAAKSQGIPANHRRPGYAEIHYHNTRTGMTQIDSLTAL